MKKIIFLGLLLVLVTTGCTSLSGKNSAKAITLDEAKTKTMEFINTNLMQAGQKATIKEAVEEDGLYKMVVAMPDGQELDSFVTKDGKKFFPQAMDMEEDIAKSNADNATKQNTSQPTATVATKNDKPEVELFVMSHCPYGTQMEKGILPVLDVLGDKVDFKLKFVDYAMHGKKELDEQLIQYCVQKNEPEKLHDYLECFLEDETKSDACLAKYKVNQSKLQSCIASTDKEFKVSELYADKSTWSGGRFPQFNVDKVDGEKYGVKGSPTLVVNGAKIQSGRDSAGLLKTICSGFNNPPAECDKKLSSTPPAPGFGFDGSGSNAGGCGS
jgi:hypothetical protein